jgi:hypothetical protein
MPEKPSVTPPVSHGSWGAAQAIVRGGITPTARSAPNLFIKAGFGTVGLRTRGGTCRGSLAMAAAAAVTPLFQTQTAC